MPVDWQLVSTQGMILIARAGIRTVKYWLRYAPNTSSLVKSWAGDSEKVLHTLN